MLHGGQFAVESKELGKGSTFIIGLPIAAKEADQLTNTPLVNNAATATGTLNLMIVDDNLDDAQSHASLLEAWGHQVSA